MNFFDMNITDLQFHLLELIQSSAGVIQSTVSNTSDGKMRTVTVSWSDIFEPHVSYHDQISSSSTIDDAHQCIIRVRQYVNMIAAIEKHHGGIKQFVERTSKL